MDALARPVFFAAASPKSEDIFRERGRLSDCDVMGIKIQPSRLCIIWRTDESPQSFHYAG